jgi:hypothetical protein
MRLTKHILAAVVGFSCAAALPAAAATAQQARVTAASSDSGGFNGPVITYPPAPPVDFAAGDVCAFGIHVTFFDNNVEQRTWSNDAGQPVFATAVGALKMRVTNTSTGRSVVADISGNGTYSYPGDGSFILSGNQFAAFMHSGDSPPNELLVIGKNGFAAVRVATVNGTRTKTVLTLKGPHRDLCQSLAAN